ncbi:hypothetical protein D3C72_1246590 [compost metagenome]
MAIGVVRQAAGQRQRPGVFAGQAFDGHQVEGGGFRQGPVAGDAVDASFAFAAQVLQHAQAAGAETAFGQQRGDGRGARAVIAQHQQARAGMQMGIERRQGTGHHRKQGDLLQRPTQAGCGKGVGRRRRNHPHLVDRYLAGQAGANAEQHGIAAGQHADRCAALLQHWRQGKGAGPGRAAGTDAAGQQVELARAADHFDSAEQGVARGLAQARVTVFAYSHHCQPGLHLLSSIPKTPGPFGFRQAAFS